MILCREILVSGLREYLAELRVSVPVTRLAKWKTTLQLIAVGFLICGEAGDAIVPVVTRIGIMLLWLSALLTLYTGWDYLQAGLHHLTKKMPRGLVGPLKSETGALILPLVSFRKPLTVFGIVL